MLQLTLVLAASSLSFTYMFRVNRHSPFHHLSSSTSGGIPHFAKDPRQEHESVDVFRQLWPMCKKSAKACLVTTALLVNSYFSFVSPSYAKDFPLYEEVWKIVNDDFFDASYNKNDWQRVKTESLEQLESGKISEGKQVKKTLKLLGDKYTRLLDTNSYEKLWKYDAIGVGLLFKGQDNGEMIISAPAIKGSSGDLAGIHKGDIVTNVNGRETKRLPATTLLDMLSNDANPELTITIGPSLSEQRTIILKRQLIDTAQDPVRFSIVPGTIHNKPGDILYITMSEFNAKSVEGMRKALETINTRPIAGIMLDLRGNPGGGFQFALNIGGMFLDSSKIMVTAVGKNEFLEKSDFRPSYNDGPIVPSEMPLFIALDELSASASEVLAAGLHDNCRASIVGRKSFGKGKIQAVFGLADGEGLTMTVAQYVSPSGRVIQGDGIPPDLEVAIANPIWNQVVGAQATQLDLTKVDLDAAEGKLGATCVTSPTSSSTPTPAVKAP